MSFFRTIRIARPRPRVAPFHPHRTQQHRFQPQTARYLSTSRPEIACPSCARPLPTNMPACTNCWSIRPLPPNTTHHELFNLPEEPNPFEVDLSALKRRFIAAQTSCHPDAWATKSSKDGDLAHALSSRLNEAYQTLLRPLARGEYILSQHGYSVSESDQVEDVAFMMEIMEARETIDEATPEDTEHIQELLARNKAKMKETEEEVRQAAGKKDWKEMKAATIRLRYLSGIARAGEKWLDNKQAPMRLALRLRHRLSLLMQSDPARAISDLHPPAKRPFSQQAVATARAPPPAKLPRTNTASGAPAPFKSPQMASQSSRRRGPRSAEAGPSSHSSRRSRGGAKQKKPSQKDQPPSNLLDGPYRTRKYIEQAHNKSPIPLPKSAIDAPRSHLNNFYSSVTGNVPDYVTVQGIVMDGERKQQTHRTTVEIDIQPRIVGVGDHPEKKQSVHLAALSACYQLQELGLLDNPKKIASVIKPAKEESTQTILSDGSVITYEQARSFMDYYCRRYKFPSPDIDFINISDRWEAIMTVDGRRIGLGSGSNKKSAQTACYLDVTKYLESCDPDLWKTYFEASKTGKDLGLAPPVYLRASHRIEDDISDLVDIIKHSALYKNRPQKNGVHNSNTSDAAAAMWSRSIGFRRTATLATKSKQLQDRRKAYLENPLLEKMRKTRQSLPVYTKAKDVLSHISENDVTICMAATGSGKTTQIPQMILDEYIDRGEGASCNIICTQPRRLAALSVADRVAKERGEVLGQSVGYQVRFESKPAEPDGSITFCTIGVFLKQLQSALAGDRRDMTLDKVTHIVVDEVHERDVDTDLLLVVLKQLLAVKKSRGQQLKIVLMSATIDPTLFQQYFPDSNGVPAKTITVPGRSFPVTKHFMEEFVPQVIPSARWILREESVQKYLLKELGPEKTMSFGIHMSMAAVPRNDEELELPYPLIAATIAHVLQISEDGHVLVFLPGWQEIASTQKVLLSPLGPLGINFNSDKYQLHILHSTIPLAEQQAIFEQPPPGVRRIILATNIAETSVTIPDVVYVIDAARVKEQRYDPNKHMSSLVSAWVGSSNLNQRAGRAGRHRSGEYFGILSKAHADSLHPHQTVEMKRVDLSNVVMHVKALNLSGMTTEEVLAAAIEPPDAERVSAAMNDLQMVGALDSEKNLTSLGRVLLQLPVDVQMGRLVLYGSFFKCLDNALALAAILTNRDPFMAPVHMKSVAQAKKESWSPEGFRSDALATLRAFNAWWSLQSRSDYHAANRFCIDNFLAKPTLLLIQKTKVHLLQAMHRAGIIEVSAGGMYPSDSRDMTVPPALNMNGNSFPLLTALIAIACQPKFGVRTGQRIYRTPTDKVCIIHPSSVNHSKQPDAKQQQPAEQKQLYAYVDKRRNETAGSGPPSTYLITTTRIDPLSYVLFGAHNVEVVDRGLECDDWLPVFGDINTLDDVQRLKRSIEACMLRVFEGIIMSRQRHGQNIPVLPREEESESESDFGDELEDYRLSSEEIKDLDIMTSDVVRVLNRFSDERLASQSAQVSRAGTPVLRSRLDGFGSGYSTPASFLSRPGTPSRLSRRL